MPFSQNSSVVMSKPRSALNSDGALLDPAAKIFLVLERNSYPAPCRAYTAHKQIAGHIHMDSCRSDSLQ